MIFANFWLESELEDPEEELEVEAESLVTLCLDNCMLNHIILKIFNRSIDRCEFRRNFTKVIMMLFQSFFDLTKFTCDGIERCQNSTSS